jgi:hypothetical protein
MRLYHQLFLAGFAWFALHSLSCSPFKSSKQSIRLSTAAGCATGAALSLSRSFLTEEANEDPEAVRAGILSVGQTMVSELCEEIQAEHDGQLADVISKGATVELNAAVGSLIIVNDDGSIGLKDGFLFKTSQAQSSIAAPLVVTAPIVRGAFLSLTNPRATLDTADLRVALAKDIIAGTSGSLKDKTSDMTQDQTLEVIGGLTNAAIKTLPEASLAGENSKESVAAVTMTAVGALPRAGIEPSGLSQAAQKLAEGAVSALSTPGFDQTSLGSLTGEVAGSAIQGLGTAGLTPEKIIETGAIASIISGAASGLKKTEASGSQTVEAIGSMAGSAVSVLTKVGLTTPELKKGALAAVVQSSMSGAQSLANNSNAMLAEAMSVVANNAVLALKTGGFENNQIGDAIAVIVETGVAEIAKSGTTNAGGATEIASKLIEGAISGAGTLMQSGEIETEQAAELARAATTGAVEGLQSLQTAGIVTGDSVTDFTSTIVESVSSGLEKAGADAETVAEAQSGATTVVESEAVQEQIQAGAGTAEPVATPTFSLAAGTYSSAISVSISSSTSGASIRYTLDGTTPTASSGVLYTGAVPLSSSKTLKAIAYKTGWANSQVASASYTVNISTFASATTVATGLNPEGIAAGDLNQDGKIDLAVALYAGRGVSFLLGNGNGTFTTKQDVSSSPNSAGTFANIQSAMITISDLDEDDSPDVLWGAWGDNFLSVLTNETSTGSSTLTWANNMPTAYNPGISGPRGVLASDVDADGHKDVVIGEANGNKLIVYMNQSASPGTLSLFGSNWLFNPDSTVYTGNTHPWMIEVGDFNNDSKPDFVGGGGFGGILSVLLNNTTVAGTPAFQTANRINTNTELGCTQNQTVTVNDFNGDGKADIAASCPTSGSDKVALFLNTTSANASAASFTVSSFDAAEALLAVTSGDVNGDGKIDIVTIADTAPNTLSYYRGNGDGTFASAETFTIGSNTGPSKVILIDLNADNRLDAVVSNGSTNQVTIFLNQTP